MLADYREATHRNFCLGRCVAVVLRFRNKVLLLHSPRQAHYASDRTRAGTGGGSLIRYGANAPIRWLYGVAVAGGRGLGLARSFQKPVQVEKTKIKMLRVAGRRKLDLEEIRASLNVSALQRQYPAR
jgi:hypothetical protein